MLSQEEIDALLKGSNDKDDGPEDQLTPEEVDALGEIGNISMGTSATTLSTLLNNKVTITTPMVSVMTWDDLVRKYPLPYVGVEVKYTQGLEGTNLLILKENDVKIITDLMMGGSGDNIDGDINDLHLSAISEAMNQMIGSASTSLSTMFDLHINISPPKSFLIKFEDAKPFDYLSQDIVVKIAFKMEVEGLIDSEIMQLIPIDFAKETTNKLLTSDAEHKTESSDAKEEIEEKSRIEIKESVVESNTDMGETKKQIIEEPSREKTRVQEAAVSVQPVQLQSFDKDAYTGERENIDLIIDVPLEVSVELGKTKKLIKDILEFGPGTVIELDRMAGEPVDIIVNGKFIAKGEVVVIDENFGVRITDIVSPNKRLNSI